MNAYLALSAISVLAGFGLLTRLRLPLAPGLRWYLAPGATMLAWAIALGVGVSFGLTLRTLSGPLLAITMVVAILGGLDAKRTWAEARPTVLLILAAVPLAVMAMDVAAGLSRYIGGPDRDGWSYVAYGQYLWEWPKGTEGGLVPLHQYAAHLSKTRFISSAMLAFFSPTTGVGGDTQAAAGTFVAWTLFVFGASCAASAAALGIRRGWLVLFSAIAVMSPWVYAAVQIHNYDNLMALSFLPIGMSLLVTADRPGVSVAVLLGAVIAATLYTYPEMSVFIGFGLTLALACRAARDRQWMAWIKTCLMAGAFSAVLLMPGRTDLAWFISSQLSSVAGAASARAGEGHFSNLLDFAKWPNAFWGFQTEPSTSSQTALATATRDLVVAALWILSVVGIAGLLRRRRWDVVVLGLGLSAGAVLLIVRQQYTYGAYKLLLLGNWAMAAAVVAGADALATRLAASGTGRAVRLTAATAGALIAISFFGSFALREWAFHQSLNPKTAAPFRALTETEGLMGSAPVLISIDNDIANAWAVYFLRRHAIRLLEYRGYMAQPHVRPLMDRAAPVNIATASYILSDDGRTAGRDVVWRGGPFALWRTPQTGAAFLMDVVNPNGRDWVNGRSFYWIGQGDTSVDVIATAEGAATISAAIARGPSLPTSPVRHLSVTTAAEGAITFTIDRDGDQALVVPVLRGLNRLVFRALDAPNTLPPASPRPMLIGLGGLSVSLGAEAGALTARAAPKNWTCSTTFVSGWHGREASGTDWMRWSSGAGRLRVSTETDADFELRGEVLSFVRPNTIDVRVDGKTVETLSVTDPAWVFHAVSPLRFRLAARHAATVELVGRAAAVTSEADPRPLAIAVKDLVLRRLDQSDPCMVRF